MKLFSKTSSPRTAAPRTGVSAFTVVEMVTAVAIFAFVIIWLVELQIFGLRIYTLAATKISATAGGRKVMNQIRDQIREANQVYVGNWSASSSPPFQPITGTNAAQGDALQVITSPAVLSSTNTIPFMVYYYLDTNSTPGTNVLMEYAMTYNYSNNIVIGTNNSTFTLASYITNLIVFDAEDYTNNILTNSMYNQCFRVTLQFSQWEYPVAVIGGQSLNAYDYYQLRTKVSMRAPEID